MIIAFRIEDSDSTGPFRSNYIHMTELAYRIHRRHANFPTPWEEPLMEPRFTRKHKCAYMTMTQIIQLYPFEDIIELYNYGFKIYQLQLQMSIDLLVGYSQIGYRTSDVTDTRELLLSGLKGMYGKYNNNSDAIG